MTPADLIPPIRAIHAALRDAVVAACERQTATTLAAVDREAEEDTIYALDRVTEDVLVDRFDHALGGHTSFVLLAEGLPPEGIVRPGGTAAEDARWRILVDPIDGTRGLMYGKRSAWVLTGVAPNRGAATRLRDLVAAVQTEIPTPKQHLSDVAWAVRGVGAHAVRHDRIAGTDTPLALNPSAAASFEHGFATVSRFFPGARDVLAAVDDDLAEAVLGPPTPGAARCFEDQYISTGGQLFELMSGRDRFVADLRPLVASVLRARGKPPSVCVHPYDLSAVLVAEEAGVVVTDALGRALDAPLDLHSDVAWVGYANAALRERVEPHLRNVLRRHSLL